MESSAIREEATGVFWIPEMPDVRVSGRLSIKRDGSFILTAEKAFSHDDCVIESAVYGVLENKKKISMHKPTYHSKTVGMGYVQPSILSSPILYIGETHIEEKSSIEGTKFNFELHGMQPWYEDENLSKKNETAGTTFLRFQDFDITLQHEHCGKTGGNTTLSSIRSPKPVPLQILQNVMHRAVTFLSFATGQILLQEKTNIENDNHVWDLHYKPAFYSTEYQPANTPLFKNKHKNIQARFEAWNNIYDKISPLIV